jgi:hyperosmotically inducible periplasmic protein
MSSRQLHVCEIRNHLRIEIMKKIISLILGSSLILMGSVACENQAKTSPNAPSSTEKTGEVMENKTVQKDQKDAAGQVRRDQLDSDIRAREQRNNMTGGDADRANADLSSEVRSKLEANIQKGQLTVTAKDGTVVVSGTVQTQEQLDKIEPLTKEIKGVKTVSVAAKVVPAVPDKQ